MHNFKNQTSRFEHIHVDIIGQLPIYCGFKCCLTCIDRFYALGEDQAISATNIEVPTMATVSINGWIWKVFVFHRTFHWGRVEVVWISAIQRIHAG